MAIRIISITSESPHKILNGYSLRVNKLLVNAARRNDLEVHCFAPVTRENINEAIHWADSKNIKFHGILLEREMQYDITLRAIFIKECGLLLMSHIDKDSIILMHGLVSIIDFANLECVESSIADMIDEVGPLMKRDVVKHLVNGRVKEFLRAIKSLWIYHNKTSCLLARYKNISVVAHDDAHRLRTLLPDKSIGIIPNGVDLPDRTCRRTSSEKPMVLFHGVYGYEPNEEAALFLIQSVAPLLENRLPQCRIVIAGRNPTESMLEAGSSCPNVEIVGEIDDMSNYLLTASVGAYPIFTRTGLQNKILEAWSHCLPIVTTPEILSVFDAFSHDVLYCARTALTANDFVEQIGDLLGDEDSCLQLSSRAFEFVKRNFEWPSVVDKFLQLHIS